MASGDPGVIVASVLAAYLLGSVPFAWLMARWVAGIDIRMAGSGNLGAANVFRTTGRRFGLAVAALDVCKGACAVWLAHRVGLQATGCTVAGLAAVAGHLHSPWLGFRGGKGVATACGAFAVLAPAATAMAAAVFIATVWVTRYVSAGSLAATGVLAPLAYVTGAPTAVVIGAAVTGVAITVRHRSNVARMRAGTERRFGQRGRE